MCGLLGSSNKRLTWESKSRQRERGREPEASPLLVVGYRKIINRNDAKGVGLE